MTEITTQFSTLGKYRLERRLGEGAMGTVWLATNPDLNIQVAIKTIKNRNPIFVQRFLQEARSAIMIDHFRVARIYDAGSEGDQHYIVMELLTGGNIGDLLDEGPLTPNFALYIIEAVTEGLAAAAKVGIIHRDIKPDNIMLDSEGEPKLVDLGLAKELGGKSNLTTTGTFMGTPAYIAPEQASGKKDIDGRADIYSLGATLFHLVTGKLPFEETNPMAMALAHCMEPTPDPADCNGKLPKPLCTLIMKMMAKEPDDRYQTPEELIRAVNAVTRKLGLGDQPKRAARRRRLVANAGAKPADAKRQAALPATKVEWPSKQKNVLISVFSIIAVGLLWFFLRPAPPVVEPSRVSSISGSGAADPVPLEPVTPVVDSASVTFTLIDAVSDQPIPSFDPIPEGAILKLADLPTRKLNIRANVAPDTEEVRFRLNDQDEHSERTPPFSLSGDSDGDYNKWTPRAGKYTLVVDVDGQTTRLNFRVEGARGASWTATASHFSDNAYLATDGNAFSRWTTGARMEGGEWFQLDLGNSRLLRSLELDTTQNDDDFPRIWDVALSADGRDWTTVKSGVGSGPITAIELPPTNARFIKVRQTGVSTKHYWSIHELKVNGKPLDD